MFIRRMTYEFIAFLLCVFARKPKNKKKKKKKRKKLSFVFLMFTSSTGKNVYRENALSELRGLHAVLQGIWINRFMHNKNAHTTVHNWIQQIFIHGTKTKTKTQRTFRTFIIVCCYTENRMILINDIIDVYIFHIHINYK